MDNVIDENGNFDIPSGKTGFNSFVVDVPSKDNESIVSRNSTIGTNATYSIADLMTENSTKDGLDKTAQFTVSVQSKINIDRIQGIYNLRRIEDEEFDDFDMNDIFMRFSMMNRVEKSRFSYENSSDSYELVFLVFRNDGRSPYQFVIYLLKPGRPIEVNFGRIDHFYFVKSLNNVNNVSDIESINFTFQDNEKYIDENNIYDIIDNNNDYIELFRRKFGPNVYELKFN